MKLINIGFGNMVSASRLVAIVSPESAPIKRVIQNAKEKNMLIDATYGQAHPGGAHHRFRACDFVALAAGDRGQPLGQSGL